MFNLAKEMQKLVSKVQEGLKQRIVLREEIKDARAFISSLLDTCAQFERKYSPKEGGSPPSMLYTMYASATEFLRRLLADGYADVDAVRETMAQALRTHFSPIGFVWAMADVSGHVMRNPPSRSYDQQGRRNFWRR